MKRPEILNNSRRDCIYGDRQTVEKCVRSRLRKNGDIANVNPSARTAAVWLAVAPLRNVWTLPTGLLRRLEPPPLRDSGRAFAAFAPTPMHIHRGATVVHKIWGMKTWHWLRIQPISRMRRETRTESKQASILFAPPPTKKNTIQNFNVKHRAGCQKAGRAISAGRLHQSNN